MATAYPPSERYYHRMRDLKAIGGPGYGGKPEKDPDPEDDFSWKKFLHSIHCWLKYKLTGDKCKRGDNGHR